MEIKPLGGRIVAKRFVVNETASGLVLPQNDSTTMMLKVISVSPDCCGDNQTSPLSPVTQRVSPGDIIYVGAHKKIMMPNSEERIILDESQVLGILSLD